MGYGHGAHHGGWHGRGHHGAHHHGGRHGFRRRFWTKGERIAWLESYLQNLQAEAQAVEEKLAKMKNEG